MKWAPVAALAVIVTGVLFVLPSGRMFPFRAATAKSDAADGASRRIATVRTAGKAPRTKVCWIEDVRPGPYRNTAAKVTAVREDGVIEVERIDAAEAHEKLRDALFGALRSRGKAALSKRYARTTDDPFNSEEAKKSQTGVHVGDIFVSGLPMIDQGDRAYCAVASAARVLQGYGIEVTMEDLALLAHSSPTGGTKIPSWEEAIREVVRGHGLELKVIPELTESMQPLGTLIQNYNYTARELGCQELDCWDYIGYCCGRACFNADREYTVQREVMLSNQRAVDAFDENVIARVDESDPLFWSVRLGDVPEESSYFDAKQSQGTDGGAHMRLIIGYNENDGEVLYTDSWGPGHELKRMDAEDALSITRGMFYLKDNPGSGSAEKVEVTEK